MKFIVFFLFIMCFHANAGNAQLVTLSLKDVSLKQVFSEMEKQTGYHFFYKEKLLPGSHKTSVNIKNTSLWDALKESIEQFPLTYSIVGKVIIIREKEIVNETGIIRTAISTKLYEEIKGVVKDKDGTPLHGVSVLVRGSTKGVSTNEDGSFTINVDIGEFLVFTMIGYKSITLQVSNNNLNIEMEPDVVTGLDEVVVTALGITREKKSLGYSAQQISGENIENNKSGNVTDALAGRIAGLQIKRSGNLGGSTNAVIRGNKSLTGDNQALWVVDGVPISNANFNTETQVVGTSGFDFGNLASDINPDDIESINVLKGAAATALYGSRAANGAIIITTKNGAGLIKNNQVLLNSSASVGYVDKSTFPKFQKKYGRGYGKFNGIGGDGYFDEYDFDGNGSIDLVAPFAQYASYGAPFDPSLLVFNWDSYFPTSPNYMKATPWVAPQNDPVSFFEKPITLDNNIAVAGNSKNGSYRFSYSNFDQTGLFPNSHLKKNSVSMNGSFKMTDKFNVSGSSNFIRTDAIGRNQTGTDFRGNAIALFRHYFTTDVDIKQLYNLYRDGGDINATHTPGRSFDNIYFNRYENFNTDERNRFFGNLTLNYEFTKELNLEGRVGLDTYDFIEEDRRSNKSGGVSRYARRNINFLEVNYDLMLKFNKALTDNFNINGVVGTNIRRTKFQSISATTNGGIIIDRLYSLSNSINQPQAPIEVLEESGVDGIYGLLSFGFKNTFFLDLTGRRDHSSTLPVNNSKYFYPSIATSFIFSQLIKSDFLSFGKLRLNYAKVGNSAPVQALTDVLIKPSLFGNVLNYETSPAKHNETLKPESTESLELGIETFYLGRRLGLDISLYKTNTKNQIIPVSVTPATGYISKFVNSGEVENTGLEIVLTTVPLKKKDLSWNIVFNWARNKNKVLSLFESVTNLQIGSVAEGVTVNATVGQPFGMLHGSDFVYFEGKRVINQSDGSFAKTLGSNNNLGSVFPEWTGGVNNYIQYKNFSFSFLIDGQKGGNIFSIDNLYGYESGAYDIFIGNNELGNPIRNSIANGGGIILDGVDPTGRKNTVRTEMNDNANAYGSRKAPNALHVYDASFIKLREATLGFRLPEKLISGTIFNNVNLNFYCNNLWIIYKSIPFSDPESGFGSGNIQGIQAGIPPSTRDFGINIKVQF